MTLAQLRDRIASVVHRARRSLVGAAVYAWPYVVLAWLWLRINAAAAWRAFRAWLGVAPESVRGQLNKEEIKRIAIKTVTATGGSSFWGIYKEPDFLQVVVIPIVIGLAVAVFEAQRRLNHDATPAEQGPTS